MNRFILRQRVLPAMIFYGLLPRSFYYLPRVEAVILLIIFVAMFIAYLLLRYKNVIQILENNAILILDSICAIAGAVMACLFNSSAYFEPWFVLTALPLFFNNYRALKHK